MITPYDEFPVHQSPHPFSQVPSTDYAWDDGMFFGVFNSELKTAFIIYMRVSPNTDVIAGSALMSVADRQYTVRLKQPWRGHFDTSMGPVSIRFVEPLKVIRVTMRPNESELTCDFEWVALGQPYTEPHHFAASRGRTTTDQTRYNQSGTGRGWIQLGDMRYSFSEGEWWGGRDHSWGLYAARPHLSPNPKWLPPQEVPAVREGLHWMSWWGSPDHSGFVSVNESEEGEQVKMNEVFGTPLVGGIDYGLDKPGPKVVAARHKMEFHPETRVLARVTWLLTDVDGGEWTQVYVPTGGFNPFSMGAWSDGGSLSTYSDKPRHEIEDVHFSGLTYEAVRPDGRRMTMHNPEYIAEVTTTAPDGSMSVGSALVELFIHGRYTPYGFEERPWKSGVR